MLRDQIEELPGLVTRRGHASIFVVFADGRRICCGRTGSLLRQPAVEDEYGDPLSHHYTTVPGHADRTPHALAQQASVWKPYLTVKGGGVVAYTPRRPSRAMAPKEYATLFANMPNSYFGIGRYLRPIDPSSHFGHSRFARSLALTWKRLVGGWHK